MATLKGQIVGNYVVGEKVGGGLSSIVYKASPRNNSGAVVAIKVIDRRELLKVSPHAEVYLKREISILQQLDHPNIVKLVEVLDDGVTIHLIMEFCQGGSLREYLNKKGKLAESEVFSILSQLVDALKYMYSKSIIHRDLKPHNILLSGDGTIKICDYGFARIYEKQKLMNSILGSPLYMAPEILASSQYTTKCDLWSVGIIMYEMLAGTVPFNTNSVVQLYSFYERVKLWGITLPREIQDVVSSECSALLSAMLKVLPEDRITWPDFFQHPFFLSNFAVNAPPSPAPTRALSTDRGTLSVFTVPRCDKVEVNVNELDEACTVKLFKLSLATKLQLDISNISDSRPPLLMICTPTGVIEMDDEKPLSAYHSIISKSSPTEGKTRLLYVDLASGHDFAGDALIEDVQVQGETDIDDLQHDENSDVGRLVRDFRKFVSQQDIFYHTTDERFKQCAKYLTDRDILLSAVKQAIALLSSNVKALNDFSQTPLDLYLHQGQSLANILERFPRHLQELRGIALHESLNASGHTTLLDLAGGEEGLSNMLALTKSGNAKLGVLVEAIKNATAKAELEAHSPVACEGALKTLNSTQREAQQWVEGLRLYREHTAKWASVVLQHKRDTDKSDVGDLEWSFVVDGLLEVRAGCAHDLGVAERLASRVVDHWEKCKNSHASVWEELSTRLQCSLDAKESVLKALHALPKLGKLLLEQQARIEKLEAVLNLQDLYQSYLHTVYSQYAFENRTIDFMTSYEKLRERQSSKLASFHQRINGSPFESMFNQGVDLRLSSLPNLQITGTPTVHDITNLEAYMDEEFNVLVTEEDAATLVRENAQLEAEVRQLKADRAAQDVKLPVVQMLGISAENEQLQRELVLAKEALVVKEAEISELRSQCENLANSMKERESEKSREHEEFSAKYAHSIEVVRMQSRAQQNDYESKIKQLQVLLEESKKETQAAREQGSQLTRELATVRETAVIVENKTNADLTNAVEAMQSALQEKNDALLNLQAALNDNEASTAELRERINILLKMQEEQTEVNNRLQQRLVQQQRNQNQQNPQRSPQL
jgi:serine/threonine protein kinase